MAKVLTFPHISIRRYKSCDDKIVILWVLLAFAVLGLAVHSYFQWRGYYETTSNIIRCFGF